MHYKSVLAISVIFLSIFFSLSQAAVSMASHHSKPLTYPLTAPITSFMHKVSGRIYHKEIDIWKRIFSKFHPANNITVKIWNEDTDQEMITKTDSNGYYMFMVDKGMYFVAPEFSADVEVVAPPKRFVWVNKSNKDNINFHAIDL